LRSHDDSEEIAFGLPDGVSSADRHSRWTSYSSRPDGHGDAAAFTPIKDRNNITGLAGHPAGLTFRHRDRGEDQPRPPTNVGAVSNRAYVKVYYTSSADIGDLIDHLSSDLDASRGRIDILPHNTSASAGMDSRPVVGQFEDPPSPRPIDVDDTGDGQKLVTPYHQFQASRGMRNEPSKGAEASPSAPSFASSGSGMPGKSVEDRLQALLDRLREGGLKEGRGGSIPGAAP
jgi:hypothetical protein